jgi:hypothetical protein
MRVDAALTMVGVPIGLQAFKMLFPLAASIKLSAILFVIIFRLALPFMALSLLNSKPFSLRIMARPVPFCANVSSS